MKRPLATAVTALVVSVAPAASPGQVPPLDAVMQQKAENAERLLKPVVLGDFDGIQLYATRLGRLTYTEVASWQGQPNSDYTRRANDFLEAIEALGDAASARDSRASAKAYAELVQSCVNCHQLVGRRRSVGLKPPAPAISPAGPR